MEGFLRYDFEGHILGGAYFWNFAVLQIYPCIIPQRTRYIVNAISLNNSQALGEIIIFLCVSKGGNYLREVIISNIAD